MGLSKENILGVSFCAPPSTTPRAVQVSRLAKGLKQKGINFQLVTTRSKTGPIDRNFDRFYAPYINKNFAEPFFHKKPTEESWINSGTKKTIHLLDKYSSRILITFAQPWSDHLIGLNVKNKRPIKWVAHFSDPWTDSPYYDSLQKHEREEALGKEKDIITNADALIFVTQTTLDKVMEKYPSNYKKRSFVIPHMLDEDTLSYHFKTKKNSKPIIVHTGNFYGKRSAKDLIEAISTVSKKHSFEFHFVGCQEEGISDLVKKEKLNNVVFFHPHQGFFSSLTHVKNADACCVIELPTIQSTPHLFLPSKVFDYLSLRKPFFSLTPKSSELSKIAASLGLPTAEPDDVNQIVAALEEILRTSYKDFRPKSDIMGKYSLQTISDRWIEVLAGVS